MYNYFFGFKERPFQLVPNPAFLFMSKSHEEALAHLDYAIAQGDGFSRNTRQSVVLPVPTSPVISTKPSP